MSSLHQDHLLAEGSEPTKGSRPTLAPARGKTRRMTGSAEEKAPNEVPTPRRGKPRTTTTQTTPTARRATGTGTTKARTTKAAVKPAAKTGTSAAATSKAAAKPATASAAGAKATAAKAAGAKTAPSKASAAKVAAKRATAKAAPAKAAAKPAAAKAATTQAATTKAATAKVAAAKVPAKPRPTPYKRPVLADDVAPLVLAAAAGGAELTDAAEAQAREVVTEVVTESAPVVVATSPEGTSPEGLVADVAQGRRRLFPRRVPSRRRRPALYLAAALAGALGVSLTPADPPAQAQTQTVSHSVSVAEQLGIGAQARPIEEITPEAASERLEELAISRNERVAEQTEAADAQRAADRAAAAAAAAAAAEAARPKAVMPVAGARLTSGFGSRWGTLHAGIDLAAPMMTPEYAVMDGVVLEAGPASGFGNAVYIQHENGDVTVYGHMEQILVSAGQVVQAGETIALLGNRGQSTGPHLHFEVHVGGLDGTKIDPIPWLRERGIDI